MNANTLRQVARRLRDDPTEIDRDAIAFTLEACAEAWEKAKEAKP